MKVSGPFDDIRVSPLTPGAAAKNLITGPAKIAGGSVKLSRNVLREGLSLPFEALGMFSKGTTKSAD